MALESSELLNINNGTVEMRLSLKQQAALKYGKTEEQFDVIFNMSNTEIIRRINIVEDGGDFFEELPQIEITTPEQAMTVVQQVKNASAKEIEQLLSSFNSTELGKVKRHIDTAMKEPRMKQTQRKLMESWRYNLTLMQTSPLSPSYTANQEDQAA